MKNEIYYINAKYINFNTRLPLSDVRFYKIHVGEVITLLAQYNIPVINILLYIFQYSYSLDNSANLGFANTITVIPLQLPFTRG